MIDELLDLFEKQRVVNDESRLEQLVSCYKQYSKKCTAAAEMKKIDNPLQHICTNECDWFHYSNEMCICIRSGNLHDCTYKQCEHRTEVDEGNSICTLTARIREETDHVITNDRAGTADQFSVSAADMSKSKMKGVKGNKNNI